MARPKKPSGTFGEEYWVIIDYQKPDGFWVISHKVEVRVPVKHRVNEKNNHGKARKMVEKVYPGCRVTNVIYC